MGVVAWIDTETLGLDADHHVPWEVGLIAPDGAEYVRQVKVTPRELSLAHPKALEIGRFEERYDAANAITRAELAVFLADVIPKGTHLCGAVVSFDEERLRRLMWAEGVAVPWHYHIIEIEAMAAGFLAGRGGSYTGEEWTPPWDSNELSRNVGVDPDDFDRHTALGDARWAKAIYERVMR